MVVHDLDLDLASGEILAVLGKNGVGKSTLLKTVMGFLPTRGGASIRLHGEEVTGQAPHQIARRGVAYAPQERALFTDISVVDNLRLGLPARAPGPTRRNPQRWRAEDAVDGQGAPAATPADVD